jgi:hypothetical protein
LHEKAGEVVDPAFVCDQPLIVPVNQACVPELDVPIRPRHAEELVHVGAVDRRERCRVGRVDDDRVHADRGIGEGYEKGACGLFDRLPAAERGVDRALRHAIHRMEAGDRHRVAPLPGFLISLGKRLQFRARHTALLPPEREYTPRL